jgi:hypothetical protein
MNFGEDLQAMNGNVPGRVDSELHLVAIDSYNENTNVIADHNRLIRLTAKHEHGALLG